MVIELKRGLPSERVVGQIARYIGWAREHLAGEDQAVQGIIVAHQSDDRLSYAVSAIPGLRLLVLRGELRASSCHLNGCGSAVLAFVAIIGHIARRENAGRWTLWKPQIAGVLAGIRETAIEALERREPISSTGRPLPRRRCTSTSPSSPW